jgi:nucleotide-binding universal stress UspA family protein
MTRQILVPLDGSVLAEAAVPHAAALARTYDAELALFRVIPPSELRTTAGWGPLPATIRAGWVEIALAQLRAELEAVAERLRSIGLVTQTEVLVAGDVASAIIGRAGRDPRTLMIAMATHGRSGVGRWVLGSVAEKVLQGAPTPLLVRAREMVAASTDVSYRTIVVPLDGSAFAEQALGQAQAIVAATTRATLLLVAVVPMLPDSALAPGLGERAWVEAEHQAEVEHLSGYLARTAARLESEGLSVRARLVGGTAAEQILQVSAAEHADLIVMATHGRSGWQRLWLGSVATKVVRSADLPVLLVRAQEQAGRTPVSASETGTDHVT